MQNWKIPIIWQGRKSRWPWMLQWLFRYNIKSIKEIIGKLGSINLKYSCLSKTLTREWEDKPNSQGEIIFKKSDKGLLSKIYKELLKLNDNKIDKLIEMQKRSEHIGHYNRYTDGKETWKGAQYYISVGIGQLNKTAMIYHHTSVRPKTLTMSNANKNVEQHELLLIASSNAKLYSHFERL